MSLLNDMLSDLDSSQPRLTPRQPNPSESFDKRSFKQYWLPCLAAVAVGYFLIVELDVFGIASKNELVEKAMPGPIDLNKKWMEVETENSDNVLSQQDSVPQHKPLLAAVSPQEPSVDITANTDIAENTAAIAKVSSSSTLVNPQANNKPETIEQKPIAILLAQAYKLLEEDQLMTPVESNAYQYFKAVLAVEADNALALQGVKRIYSRYLDLAAKAYRQGHVPKGDVFVRRAEVIAPISEDDLLKLRGSEETKSKYAGAGERPSSNNDLNIVVSSSHSDKNLAEMLRKRVTATLEGQVYSRLQNGEVLNASVIALANHYAKSPNHIGLGKLLSATNEDAAKHYISAQLAIIRGDFPAAQRELETARFSESTNDQWRIRLLSAACQKNREFECAVAGYSQLVSSSFQQVNDWLGLAVSLDSQGNINSALSAYKNVVDLIPAENRVAQFARQRISDLSSMSYSR